MTDIVERDPDIINQAIIARQTLQAAYKRIRDILQERLSVALQRSIESRRRILDEGTQEVLHEMSKTVVRVISEWHEVDGDCYFWPSYETITQPAELARVSLRPPVENQSDSPNIPCGYGRSYTNQPANEPKELYYCTIAEWYHRLFSTTNDRLVDGKPFRPGSTHDWMSSEKFAFTTLPEVSTIPEDAPRLISLHIDNDPNFDRNYRNSQTHRGFIDICLPSATSDSRHASLWGKYISAVLNNSGEHIGSCGQQVKHHFRPREQWPAVPGSPDSKLHLSTLQPIRESLYSMWLAATFTGCEQWHKKHHDWISECLVEWEKERILEVAPDGFVDLAKRIRDGFKLPDTGSRITVNHWYVLHIEPTIAIRKQTAELGSAMIFTQYPLPHALQLMISSWTHKIFQSIRYMESGLDLQETGQEDAVRAMGHEIKHIAKAFRLSWLPELSDIFDVHTVDAVSSPPTGKIGLLILEKKYADDIAVVPLKSLVEQGSCLIDLWCMSDSNFDLPFDIDSGNRSLQEFATLCWQKVLGAMSVHALSKMTLSSRREIDEMRILQQSISAIYNDKLVMVGGDNFPVLQLDRLKDIRPITLGRILISVFTNCVRHGDPTTQTFFFITKDPSNLNRYTFKISDYRHKRHSNNQLIKLIQQRHDCRHLDAKEIELALNAVRIADDSQTLVERGGLGQKVLRNLLQKWDGDIDYWPKRENEADYQVDEEVVMQFRFHYES